MRTFINTGIIFSLLFALVFAQACWLGRVNFNVADVTELLMPLLAGLIVGGLSSTSFFVGARIAGSDRSVTAVVFMAILLFLLLNLSNKLFLPGFWLPTMLVAAAAFLFGFKRSWFRATEGRS